MLYNPNWEKSADVYSLDSLIAWLEKQPAHQAYDFCNPHTCLVAQYLMYHGQEMVALRTDELKELGWYDIVRHELTFGAALGRARAALPAVQ